MARGTNKDQNPVNNSNQSNGFKIPDFFSWFGASAGGGQSSGLVNPAQPVVTRDPVTGQIRLPSGATNSQADQTAVNTIDSLELVRIDSQKREQLFGKNDILKKIVFPLDLESAPVPHVFIKIFETETGAVESTDLTSTTFRAGAETAGNFLVDNATTATSAYAGLTGAFYGGALGLLRGGVRGALVGAAGGAATGAATGAAAAEFGPEAANTIFTRIGETAGISDLGSRTKKLISNFALKRNIVQLKTAIALLMPETLAVSYQNDYGAISFTQAAGGLGQLAQAIGSLKGTTGNPDPFIAEAAGRLAESFINEDFAKLGFFATTGRTINPQLELIYNSPQLRDFTMDFRLVPRNASESDAIRNLIKTIKFYASPRIPKDTGGRYFIPPAQFELEFYHNYATQNLFLFKTKKCVLEDISVDYTGSGTYATFRDGAPVEVRLSLRFKETVVIDRDAVVEGF